VLGLVQDKPTLRAGAASGILDQTCARRSAERQVGTKGWPLWSNKGMWLGKPLVRAHSLWDDISTLGNIPSSDNTPAYGRFWPTLATPASVWPRPAE